MIQEEHSIFRPLGDNSEKASQVRNSLSSKPDTSLEVVSGPLELGISAFLPEIPA
jgi:hypothetical protein